jgi:hypothetical protein
MRSRFVFASQSIFGAMSSLSGTTSPVFGATPSVFGATPSVFGATPFLRAVLATFVLAGCVLLTGCDQLRRSEDVLPPLETAEAMYDRHGLDANFRYSGNVLELVVQQPEDQLRRGGSLWARVGPYIYVFTPATQELLQRYPAVAGVRVITMVGDVEVARALLLSDRLNDITWRRAQNTLARALEDGTARPSLLDRLVQFGEEHTQFEYNPEFVGRQG